ncbi:MAG: pyruvate ferredoxin oxidoreductase [Nanoarchaeota archaeon]|nr:pyruvate ferredoxin oxidoreductase [Nanoarchaeota archaeon]
MVKTLALTGSEASAEAWRQINPDVAPVYPITPTTEIISKFSQYHADGKVDTEMMLVECEHSAMSAAVGAAASSARTVTATDSQGLAYMWEVIPIASGLRLPIVMQIANRALSSPGNIHCDHGDSMACRDTSWIQIFSETAQEVYEHTLLATKLAEHKDVQLPAMVMQDGFITSGNLEKVKVYNDTDVRQFIGSYNPTYSMLDLQKPHSFGALNLHDSYFESKRQQEEAMRNAKKLYLQIGKDLSKITGNKYDYFEKYRLDDAQYVIICLNATGGTTKEVIDRLRAKKKKVGLLRIKLFRPFPYDEIANALKKARAIAVLDRSESYGAYPPVFGEINNALNLLKKKPKVQSYIFGIGGRYIFEKDIENVYSELMRNKFRKEPQYIGVR